MTSVEAFKNQGYLTKQQIELFNWQVLALWLLVPSTIICIGLMQELGRTSSLVSWSCLIPTQSTLKDVGSAL